MSSEDGAGNKQRTIRRFISQLPHSQLLEQQVTVIRTIMQSTNTVKQEGKGERFAILSSPFFVLPENV